MRLHEFQQIWENAAIGKFPNVDFAAISQPWMDIIRSFCGKHLDPAEITSLTQILDHNDKLVATIDKDHPLVDVAYGPGDAALREKAATSLVQIIHLMSAHIHAVLAAESIRINRVRPSSKPPSDAVRPTAIDPIDQLRLCCDHLRQAWPDLVADIFDGDSSRSIPASPMTQIDDVTDLLERGLPGVPSPIWLAVRQLVLEFSSPHHRSLRPVESQEIHPLMVDGAEQGIVVTAKVHLVPGGRIGYYVDPWALGLVAMDTTFQQCLRLIWKLARGKLVERMTRSAAKQIPISIAAVCIEFHLPAGLLWVEGESAGGLLACAMYASSCGEKIDRAATASVWIAPRHPSAWDSPELNESDIVIRPVGLPQSKVDGVAAARMKDGERLRDVVFAAEQAQSIDVPSKIKVHGASSFHELYKLLVRGARCRAVLEVYCQSIVARWKPRGKGTRSPRRVDRPTRYIAPHYGLLKRGLNPLDHYDRTALNEAGEKRESRYIRLADETTGKEGELVALLRKGSRRICVTEDAGAGKTVFGMRVRAFLSSATGRKKFLKGLPGLAVHWESRDPGWPRNIDELRARLTAAVRPACARAGRGITPEDVVNFALEHSLVTIVFDALDQLLWQDSDRLTRLDELWSYFEHDPHGAHIRVVVTGRAMAVATESGRFPKRDWRFGTIFGFDRDQLETYFRGLYEDSVTDIFPHFDDIEELLRVPVLASMAREMAWAKYRDQQKQLPVVLEQLGTRGAFYRAAHEILIKRAEKQGLQIDATKSRRYLQILAATAFTFMVRRHYGYMVAGSDRVADIQEEASARLSRPVTAEEWTALKRFSELSDHCILEGMSHELLSWKHRGWMEYFCGVFLARFARDEDLSQLNLLANDSQWYWAWRFAIEMADELPRTASGNALGRSLRLLFQRPIGGRRPTELMYRAWHLVDGAGDGLVLRELGHVDAKGMPLSGPALAAQAKALVLPGTEWFSQDFLAEFRSRVATGDPMAASLVPEVYLVAKGLLSPDDADRRADEHRSNFSRCPRVGLPTVLVMGGTKYGDERPVHPVRFSHPVWLSSAPVTGGQYSLFDPAWQPQEYWSEEQLQSSKFEATCPAIGISWWDAFCFAKWCGCRLPTEAEWEYACRAGTSTDYSLGPTLTTEQANFGSAIGRTTPVRSYGANAWGLYDMHGNVLEWCWDWYDNGYYGGSPQEDPPGPTHGVSRVIRGGGWDDGAGLCRSACRFWCEPEVRINDLGFRLACVPSSQAEETGGGATSDPATDA